METGADARTSQHTHPGTIGMKPKPTIVLYNPRSVFYTMPLALVSIAAGIDRSVFDVRIIDGRLESDPVAAVVAALDNAVLLGITVLTGSPIHDALLVGRAAKQRRPELPVVWGGWHPSLFPTEILSEPSVDVAVRGQGEVTFVGLVERLAAGVSLEGLEGIAYRADGEPVLNPPRALASMDELPPADYELMDVDRYFDLKNQRQLDYISSVGCYFRCAFCADPFVYARGWTAVSPSRVGEEVEALWRKHSFTELAFQDETFFTRPDRVEAIAGEFLQRDLDLQWTATLRADQGVRLGEERFAYCVRSGMRRVLVGVESGSQEMLDWMQKDVTIEQVLETAEMCVRHKVAGIFPFIVGFPGESDESVDATLTMIKRLRAMSPSFETPLFYFKPYPGSKITQDIEQAGYGLPTTLEEWAGFDFIGSAAPWVSSDKHRLIERFKFYNRFAGGPETWMRKPLQLLSRWRCERDFYDFPLEQKLVERIMPSPRLS
jgi:anaerobic magnesium-protoporphyrin IX monomethyl ester cyclase